MMQVQCFGNMSWELLFYVQAFVVPSLYVVLATLHLLVSYTLKVMSARTTWTHWLIRLGWRPRRDFSLEAVVFLYGPTFIVYMNAYYVRLRDQPQPSQDTARHLSEL